MRPHRPSLATTTAIAIFALAALFALPALAAEAADIAPAEPEPIDLEALLGTPEATDAAGQSCSASWDCPFGNDISCLCSGSGSCTSAPRPGGGGEVSCTCGGYTTYYKCFPCGAPYHPRYGCPGSVTSEGICDCNA